MVKTRSMLSPMLPVAPRLAYVDILRDQDHLSPAEAFAQLNAGLDLVIRNGKVLSSIDHDVNTEVH